MLEIRVSWTTNGGYENSRTIKDTGVSNGDQAAEGVQQSMKRINDLSEVIGVRAIECPGEIRELVRRLWFEIELG